MDFLFHQGKPFLLKTWKGIRRIEPSEIVFIQAEQQGISVTLINGQICESPSSLLAISEDLAKLTFFRIHRKFLINVTYVCEYLSLHSMVRIQTEQVNIQLPVSRRNRSAFICFWQSIYQQEQVA
ncbi:MAG: LytTR family transcriptional regulator DNA-binding domain-containing protein [Bacteroidales bacterium]|nr:LytTR family transcriptional regulator DNA-binding domain-containing protein [Bacteroidales bacterium]